MSAEAYIDQLHWAERYLKADRRVHSAQIFTWDYGNNEWHSFAVREIREPFLQYVISQRDVPDPAQTAFPLYPPNVTDPLPPGGGTMTLTDRLAAVFAAEFGAAFEDLRGRLPVHQTLRYNAIDSRGFDYIAIHHSDTEKTRTWANIA